MGLEESDIFYVTRVFVLGNWTKTSRFDLIRKFDYVILLLFLKQDDRAEMRRCIHLSV